MSAHRTLNDVAFLKCNVSLQPTLTMRMLDKKIVHPSRIVQYHEYPQQKNLIDCGLFTAGVMLRLFEGRDVQINSFLQTSVTKLRDTLAALGVGKRRYHKLQQISVIREAFGLDFDQTDKTEGEKKPKTSDGQAAKLVKPNEITTNSGRPKTK